MKSTGTRKLKPVFKEENVDTQGSGTPAIELNCVWKIFGDCEQQVLKDMEGQCFDKQHVLETYDCVVGVADASFTVSEGEIFCIMGLSGSGKSTLVRHINRLLEPSVGQILVHGRDVMTMDAAELRDLRNRTIAMVFQNFGLIPHRTVRDNVSVPLEIRGVPRAKRWQEAERVLEMVDLAGWEDKYAHELSGGMQQRVGLARAIAADPRILLMDEPFSALDPLIRRQLQEQFMELAQNMGKTTVFITHDLDEAIRIGHRIAIMKDGRLVQIGTPEEIVTNPVDEYVTDFVAGISRLRFVHAESLMSDIDAYQYKNDTIPGNSPAVPPDADLDSLVDISIEWDGPIRVENNEGKTIGVIDRKQILRGIKGNGASS